MTEITTYHNPACGTSRNVLSLIRNSGVEPRIVEYLKIPPSQAELADLIRRMGVPVRAVLREKGTPYAELGLGDPALTDDQLLDAMAAHSILINRPIVVTSLGVRLCRPAETVLAILPAPQGGHLQGPSLFRREPDGFCGQCKAISARWLPCADRRGCRVPSSHLRR